MFFSVFKCEESGFLKLFEITIPIGYKYDT